MRLSVAGEACLPGCDCHCGNTSRVKHHFGVAGACALCRNTTSWTLEDGAAAWEEDCPVLSLSGAASATGVISVANPDFTGGALTDSATISACVQPCRCGCEECAHSISIDEDEIVLGVKSEVAERTIYAQFSGATPGPAHWSVSPSSGLSVVSSLSGDTFTFCPTNSAPGEYVVTAADADDCAADSVNVIICDVEIVEFENLMGTPVEEMWPAHSNMDSDRHLVECKARVIPERAGLEVAYSLTGDTHGAGIDPQTGLITPASDESGEITVRASAGGVDGCYAEKDFLIRAIPIAITNSVVDPSVAQADQYGAGWTHSFGSSGGSLENVQLSEHVRTVHPNPLGYNFEVNPDPRGFFYWKLSDDGTISPADKYVTARRYFDVTKFDTLPQSGKDLQYYFWWCEPCVRWVRFCGPNAITTTLCEDSDGGFSVITSAYGVSYTNAYTGAVPQDDPWGGF